MREEKKKKRGRVPFFSSIQMKYAMSYLAIFAVVLVLLVFLPDLLDDSNKKGKGKGAGEDPTAHN